MKKSTYKKHYLKAMERENYEQALKIGADYVKSLTDEQWQKIQKRVFPRSAKSTEIMFNTLDRLAVYESLQRTIMKVQGSAKGTIAYNAGVNASRQLSNLLTKSTREWAQSVSQEVWQGWKDNFYDRFAGTEQDKQKFEELIKEIEERGLVTQFTHSQFAKFRWISPDSLGYFKVWESEHGIDMQSAKMEDFLTAHDRKERRSYMHSDKIKVKDLKVHKYTNKEIKERR